MNSILSYCGLQKQWNSENDIQNVIDDLNNNTNSIETLHFSGNSLGVLAAEKLSEPLAHQSNLKRLFWNDLFTGRLKTEIGVALKSLSVGLIKAQVNLVELDLSDNAFGPNGVVGVTDLLASPCCYTLKVLNMNNQGLGHQGCRQLVDALKKARQNSGKRGMNLEVFIAGRNRLENAGMKMLSEVFGDGMSSLQKLVLLQNGIGIHGIEGIESLIDSIKNHKQIQILNISDNTIKPMGIRLLSGILPNFEELEELYLGDCLIKNKGINILTDILDCMSVNLKKISVSGNEITGKSAINFLNMIIETKRSIESIDLTENEIKKSDKLEMIDLLTEMEKLDILVKSENDEDEEEEDEEDDDDENESGESEENHESDEDTNSEDEEDDDDDDYYEEEDKEEILINSKVEQKLEPVKEAPMNIFSTSKGTAETSSFLFTKNLNGNLFGPKPQGSDLFSSSSNAPVNMFSSENNGRVNLFSTKPQTNIFSTNGTESNTKFVFGTKPSIASNGNQKPFSFLEAAKPKVNTNEYLKKSILECLKSKSIMSISGSSLKIDCVSIDKDRLFDGELCDLVEENPEKAIRIGFILCDNATSFDIGVKLIHSLLSSKSVWSTATNALLVEMNCIKSEEKKFVPYCCEDNTLAIKVIKKMLEMSPGVPIDVRLNLSTVLKNLNKFDSNDTDLLLEELESGLSSLRI